MSEHEAAVQDRPRRATRELITWLAAILLLVGLYQLVAAVVLPFNQLTQPGGTVRVNAPLPEPAAVPLPPGTHLEPAFLAESRFEVAELPAGLRMLSESEAVLTGLALGVGALLLRRVLLSIADGRPFDRRNPRRIVGLAACLLVGGSAASVAAFYAALAVLDHVGVDGTGTGPLYPAAQPVDLDGLAYALLALAVAEAFRRGRRLTDDVDGLV